LQKCLLAPALTRARAQQCPPVAHAKESVTQEEGQCAVQVVGVDPLEFCCCSASTCAGRALRAPAKLKAADAECVAAGQCAEGMAGAGPAGVLLLRWVLLGRVLWWLLLPGGAMLVHAAAAAFVAAAESVAAGQSAARVAPAAGALALVVDCMQAS